jgi:trk system potassium uptake protein TrkA
MMVVVAGAGAVGTFLAEDLAKSGHDVLIIEKNPAGLDRMPSAPSIRMLAADACEVDVLQNAEVDRADVVVAATGDDEDNLVISLLAKQEFAVPRVIARVNHPKNHWLFNESWGVDIAVSTPHVLSALVEEAVSIGSLVRLLHFERSDSRLVEVTLAEGSPAADATIEAMSLPRGATVVAVVRDSQVMIPRPDLELRVGDEVIVLLTSEREDEVRKLLVAP